MNDFLKAIYDEKLNMSEDQLYQIAEDNGVCLHSPEYRVLIVSTRCKIDSPERYHKYCVELPERCHTFFARRRLHAEITEDYSGKCIILLLEKATNSQVEELAYALLSFFDSCFLTDSIIAVGKRVVSFGEIAHSYRTAVNALNYQSLYSGERCLFCEDMHAMLNLSTLQSVMEPNRMLQAFQADNISELRMLVTAYAEKVRSLSGESIEGRHPTSIRRMFVELTVYVLHIASDMGVDVDSILKGLDPYNFLLANDKSTPMIIDWFIGMCSDLRTAIEEKTKKKEQNIIQQVCDYIEKHITQYDLSLDDAAAAVNMTASYISKLFRKEMGIGFSKYVAQNRLKTASKLLVETDLSVKEISDRAGFASANYFGTVFKREYGISPLLYRAQNADVAGQSK